MNTINGNNREKYGGNSPPRGFREAGYAAGLMPIKITRFLGCDTFGRRLYRGEIQAKSIIETYTLTK